MVWGFLGFLTKDKAGSRDEEYELGELCDFKMDNQRLIIEQRFEGGKATNKNIQRKHLRQNSQYKCLNK